MTIKPKNLNKILLLLSLHLTTIKFWGETEGADVEVTHGSILKNYFWKCPRGHMWFQGLN